MALQVHWRVLLDGGPSCFSSHLDERGGNLAQQQPEGVCMGGFPGLGMGPGRKKTKHKTKERKERPVVLVQALERPPSALLTGFPGCDLLGWVSDTGRATGKRTWTPGESVLTTVLGS